MKAERLYSVVVPTYGVEKYLPACVDSLLCQTYKNIEIILVDDGSRDGSPEICDRYAEQDGRVRVIHKENGGLVSARKAGARVAAGEYIICVDGDDWVSDDYVELFNSAIEKYKPDAVCCGYIRSDGENEERFAVPVGFGHYDRKKLETEIYPIAIEGEGGDIFPPQLWAKAFRRDIYLAEQLALDDGVRIGEDGAVVKPIMTKIESLCVLPECAYYYRVAGGSMTQSGAAYDLDGPRLIMDHLFARIDTQKFDFEAQILRRTVRDIYTVVFSQFNRNESYGKIKKDVIRRLSSPDYKEVLKNCSYKSPKRKLQLWLLRQRWIFPICILNKI